MSHDMPSRVSELLTWNKVYTWARAQQGSVGISDSLCDCPLARYLRQATGWELSVGYLLVMHGRHHDALIDLPAWAKQVVKEVDRHEHGTPIGGPQFLKLLDHCQPAEEAEQ
jgi:hypothetical protein